MRILHFYKTYFPDSFGGIENVIYQIASGVAKFDIQSEVLCLTSKKNFDTPIIQGNHKVHRVYQNFEIASTGVSLAAFKRFKELLKQVDIIHYHFPWPFMDLVHFTAGVNKPTIITYHSDIIRQKNLIKIYRPLKFRFLESVNHIIATSPNYLETSPVLNKYRHKTTVIPIGLNKELYVMPKLERLSYWRQKFSGQFFLFLGTMRYYKGLHVLLEAAKNVHYPIVLAGAGYEEYALREQAQDFNLNHIHFIGQLTEADKVALLMLCYAFIFPSHLRSEAFGVSLLEAAMFGKAMISCELGTGTSFINRHKKTGLVVTPNDSFALEEAMRYLWKNPEETADMGREAEKRYYEVFTAEQMCEKYSDLYDKVGSEFKENI